MDSSRWGAPARRRGSRSRLGRLAVATALLFCIAGSSLATAESASGYTPLFRKFLKPAVADPCRELGVGGGGGLIVREWKPPKPSIERYVALLCGPVVHPPSASVLLASDQIKRGSPERRSFAGGIAKIPWNGSISTEHYGYVKGPRGKAPAVPSQPTKKQVDELAMQLQKVFAIQLDFDLIFCVIGALETEGLSCLPLILAKAGLKHLIQFSKVSAWVILEFIDFIKSRADLAGSNWFYWADNYGFWNYFGSISPSYMDPSITLTGAGAVSARMGLVLSNVGLDQGPDFNLPRELEATGDPEAAKLAGILRRVEDREGVRRVGKAARSDRLHGGPREDLIHGRALHDSIHGHGGDDRILQGGQGRDRIFGGRGADNIDGGRGKDRLYGGRGRDQIVDFFGPTVVHPGRGANLVMLRDGRGDDRVRCRRGSRDLIRIDPGDRVGPRCLEAPIRIRRGGPMPVIR